MTLKNQILQHIRIFPGATDNDLEHQFHKAHQAINQACHSLEKEGHLVRRRNQEKGNLIGNYPVDYSVCEKDFSKKIPVQETTLQEEEIKHILAEYPEQDGWSDKVAWWHSHGIDIDAHKDGQRWILEVKGPGS